MSNEPVRRKMKSNRNRLAPRIGFCFLILLGLIGCRHAMTEPAPTPTQENGNLSADAIATLNSLEKVDGYPLYVMHYVGSYEAMLARRRTGQAGFACSLFAAFGNPDHLLFGRNFDWDYSPTLLLFTVPPDGYASVSVVDLTFLGFTSKNSSSLEEATLTEQQELLGAPAMPFDGMNEYGLVIGMAAVPESIASTDPDKPAIGSIGIMREILDHARNTDEALAIFEQYNIDFTGGPPIHYLLADASGEAVLVEFVQGKMITLPNENPWHLATNHLRATASGDGGCARYRAIDLRLTATGGSLTPESAMDLLSQVSQSGSTQWSAVYDISTGSIQIAMGADYGTVHTFQINLVAP
jgi:hypothetical protein